MDNNDLHSGNPTALAKAIAKAQKEKEWDGNLYAAFEGLIKEDADNINSFIAGEGQVQKFVKYLEQLLDSGQDELAKVASRLVLKEGVFEHLIKTGYGENAFEMVRHSPSALYESLSSRPIREYILEKHSDAIMHTILYKLCNPDDLHLDLYPLKILSIPGITKHLMSIDTKQLSELVSLMACHKDFIGLFVNDEDMSFKKDFLGVFLKLPTDSQGMISEDFAKAVHAHNTQDANGLPEKGFPIGVEDKFFKLFNKFGIFGAEQSSETRVCNQASYQKLFQIAVGMIGTKDEGPLKPEQNQIIKSNDLVPAG